MEKKMKLTDQQFQQIIADMDKENISTFDSSPEKSEEEILKDIRKAKWLLLNQDRSFYLYGKIFEADIPPSSGIF